MSDVTGLRGSVAFDDFDVSMYKHSDTFSCFRIMMYHICTKVMCIVNFVSISCNFHQHKLITA